MSAETLRRAATLMRERAGEPVAQPERWPQFVAPKVADWLDETAEDTVAGVVELASDHPALAVANAYLQETP